MQNKQIKRVIIIFFYNSDKFKSWFSTFVEKFVKRMYLKKIGTVKIKILYIENRLKIGHLCPLNVDFTDRTKLPAKQQ